MADEEATQEEEYLDDGEGVGSRFQQWFAAEGAWWAASFVFHMVLICTLMLIGVKTEAPVKDDAPSIEEPQVDAPEPPQKLDRFEVGEVQLDPGQLTTESLSKPQLTQDTPTNALVDSSRKADTTGPQLGGLGGFDFKGVGSGAAVRGGGGLGVGGSTGSNSAGGGTTLGFSGRGSGATRRTLVAALGGTKVSEKSVSAALNWIARHQNADGSWSLDTYGKHCKDPTCSSPGKVKSPAAATALALLPFLAAGQTHISPGPYKATIYNGLAWLMRKQKDTGDLSAGGEQSMYTHGLASITLCEAFGLTNDRVVGACAQHAIEFIEFHQNSTGGWRYTPEAENSDTSVVGWQFMALKSGLMAGLSVNHGVMKRAQLWLKTVSSGNAKGLFGYSTDRSPEEVKKNPKAPATVPASPTMTAVGLLCNQYMGVGREDPMMKEGVQYLMHSLPDHKARNIYYWYYATQTIHNVVGAEWDTWNRKMRRVLVESQIHEHCCAEGSWDPIHPTKESPLLGEQGGRLAITSLSALTLEVYYRYLPLYKLGADSPLAPAGGEGSPNADGKPENGKSLHSGKTPAKKTTSGKGNSPGT
jgi:hypothetical protein